MMIGPKKLSTIRQELQQAAAASGDDAISRLEERVTAAERQASVAAGESEVVNSLRRFLAGKRRRQRLKAKSKK
jgi:hypothetical protein